jgi:hypothetical protein
LARASDQIRSSDVTLWGVIALVCGGLAVLSANVSALIPGNMLAGLHASRLNGATIGQLRAQVATLQADTARLTQENTILISRFTLAEQQSGSMIRRIGALEVSLPNALEAARSSGIDPNDVTASIGDGEPVTYPAEGGSVEVQQTEMPPLAAPADEAAQAEPASALAPDPDAVGVSLGAPVTTANAGAAWRTLNGKVGTLLIGLAPLVGDAGDPNRTHLIAGPLDPAAATTLCRQLALVGIACTPVPYLGTALAGQPGMP